MNFAMGLSSVDLILLPLIDCSALRHLLPIKSSYIRTSVAISKTDFFDQVNNMQVAKC